MTQKNKISPILFAFSMLFSIGQFVSAMFFLNGLILIIRVLIQIFFSALVFLLLVFYLFDKPVLFRFLFTITVITFVVFVGYVILYLNGAFDKLYNIELIKSFILSTGIYGQIVYIVIQIIQVVFLPIPSIFINLAGIALFGPLQAFFLITTGVMIGSIIAFLIGRLFGAKLVGWIVGNEDLEKYRKILDKGKHLLIFMFLFPMFPDDMLCMAAGLTTMSWGYFLTVAGIARPITVGLECFFGSGILIPFHGWGIAVWIVIFIITGVLFSFVNKYRENIYSLSQRIFIKKRKKKKVLPPEEKID